MNSKPLPIYPILGLVFFCLLGLWLFVSGCGRDPDIPAPPDPPKAPELKFKTWDKPAAALIFSGEQHGYIEPCGCSETQSGGLARRADLIHDLMKLGWPVAGLDLGGSLRLAKAEAGEELRSSQFVNKLQSLLKLNTQLAVMEELRYSAMALGFEEILLDGGTLLNEYQDRLNPQGQNIHPVFMDANMQIFGPDSGLGPVTTQTLTVGEQKVGVTAIVGMSIRKKLFGDNPGGDIEIIPPAEVLPEMVAKLKADQTNFNVLLAHATFEETKELLEKFPDFAVALCLSSGDEGREEPQTVGNTLVLEVGWKGKHVGLLAYYPNDAKQKFRYELVELDNKNFENDPSVEPQLIAYQQELEKNAKELFSSENMFRGFHPKGGEFVGAATCGECHTKAYKKWKSSKHAHAYETLKTGRKGQYSQPISRIHDPECLSCHVTGWSPQGVFRYQSGFLPEELSKSRGWNDPEAFQNLQGQQCENCHGPGSAHVELEWQNRRNSGMVAQDKLLAGRRGMKLTKEEAKENLCRKCHDLENSPKFEFDKYWSEIVHPWRD